MSDAYAMTRDRRGWLERTTWPTGPVRLATSLAVLLNIVAAWEERKRFRWKLEQKSKDNPCLIDDIGLTERQVEAEIAKPFWQA